MTMHLKWFPLVCMICATLCWMEVKASTVGVNWSRYQGATAGCWVADPGYWNEYCSVVSAEKASLALDATGFNHIKLFAPGRIPQNDFAWQFEMWKQDLRALSRLERGVGLFIGIPNNALFEIAGVDFSLECDGVVYHRVEDASTSPRCGGTEEERHERVLNATLDLAQTKIPAGVPFSCHGRDFPTAREAYHSRGCSWEEVSTEVAQLLVKHMDLNDFRGAQRWIEEFVTQQIPAGSTLKIEYIGVGNEPFAQWYHDLYDTVVLLALHKAQLYLNQRPHATLAGTKLAVPFAGTYASKPIHAVQVLDFLEKHNSIFLQNIYPHTEAYSSLMGILDQLNGPCHGPHTADAECEKIVELSQEQLLFMQDFIAWSTGGEISPANRNRWGTPLFFQSYIEAYQRDLQQKFGRSFALPVWAGETGWPSENDRVYLKGVAGDVKQLSFKDLHFVSRQGRLVADVPYSQLKQIISNELFNPQRAADFTRSVARYWKQHESLGGYFFELIDEANKVNEAKEMPYELEPHYGLFQLTTELGSYSVQNSRLVPKFDLSGVNR